MQKIILILAETNLKIDGRIRRHILALKDNYKIIVTGQESPEIEGNIEFIDSSKDNISRDEWERRHKRLYEHLSKREFDSAYWEESYINKLYSKLKMKKFDLILANDIMMVPLAVKIASERNIKVIADMHEYAPRQLEQSKDWIKRWKNINHFLCEKYLSMCNALITVSEGIRNEYYKQFRIKGQILTNAPLYHDLNIKPTSEKHIRLVYHGGYNRFRNLDELIKLDKYLDDRFTIDFYLLGNDKNESFINFKEKIRNTKRCFLRDIVKPEEIVNMLHAYDIGIYLFQPISFNLKYCIPNKFLEFIQARLGVAVGSLIETDKYINNYKCGIISKDYTAKSLAEALNKLTSEDINKLKENTVKLAEKENFENNKKILNNIVDELMQE